jgi:two-component system cell cycle response regulator DivK
MCHKILLVEDDETNRDMVSRLLILDGYDVLDAVNGLEAIAIAHSEAPDLILMDISLPELDGLQATRRLKSDPATQRIPIIILTAHAMRGDEQLSFDAGCDAYETKPIDWPRLMTTMETQLNRGSQDGRELPSIVGGR